MASTSTLKQRVTWALTGAVALFVALQAVLAYLVLDEQEDRLVDQIVLTEAERLHHRLDADEVLLPESGNIVLGPAMQAWVVASPEVKIPPPMKELTLGQHQLTPGGRIWHVVVMDSARGRIYLTYDATDNEQRVYEFGATLVGLWLACTLAGYCLSRIVAGRVVRPMVEVANRIAGWAPGSPGIKADRDDEAGRLIEAFNRVQDRVDHSIGQEREFSANLSHEIRTPLTAIRTDAELAAMEPSVAEPIRARLTRIVASVDEVAATLETARAISSALAGPRVPVVLGECLDDAWSGLFERALRTGLTLVDNIPSTAIVEVDRYGLLIVLRNLIRNAIEYAAPGTLTVSWTGDGLVLADNGPGIAEDDLSFVFERYYRGRWKDSVAGGDETLAHGDRGLGLAIAKRVCDIQGWSLAVKSETEGQFRGTRFFLRFS